MSTPAPRPALRKAADAHIHPAAPGHETGSLRHAEPAPDPEDTQPAGSPVGAGGPDLTGTGHRLSGPPAGTTSDSLRTGKRGRRPAQRDKAAKEKQVDLGVQVPKSLRKDLRAAARASGRKPDEIVTALLRGWLHG